MKEERFGAYIIGLVVGMTDLDMVEIDCLESI